MQGPANIFLNPSVVAFPWSKEYNMLFKHKVEAPIYFSIPFNHRLFSFPAVKSVCGIGDYCTKRINLLNMQNLA